MHILHLHDDTEDTVPAPLPFPIDLATGRGAQSAIGSMDSIAHAEEALEQAQLSMDNFKAMFGPIDTNEDGPSAA